MKPFHLILPLLLLLLPISMQAQLTKVHGRVTEMETGEPIPFAAVFFEGTTIGVTTDLDGTYSLETRDPAAKVLVCQLLGYNTQMREIRQGAFQQEYFILRPTENQLASSFVKADNRRVRRLLAAIDSRRERNDPDAHPAYKVKFYNKMEFDLTHAKEQITNKRFLREFGFVFDYMDTSSVSGVPYLPILISETVAERSHTSNPESDYENVEANRISGVNPDNNLLSQFTGSMHMKANFYKPFVNSFGIEFPSPIQNGGLLYYNYYIIDSLQIEGRKNYLVRYHPKSGISSPAFDGEMMIDCEDWALTSISAKMKRGGNVNWLRDVVLNTTYRRLPDSTWFYGEDKLYADFSIALGDSTKMMSVLGHREIIYQLPEISPDIEAVYEHGPVKVGEDAGHFSEEYWAAARPYELSEREKSIYEMVEQIKDVPLYRNIYDVVYTLVNGYWEMGKVGIGPYFKVVSFNNLEGFRLQMGLHTSRNFSTKRRFNGYLAYGFGDHGLKGGVGYERMFRRDRTWKLTLDAHYDVLQLGKSASQFTDAGNILASVMGKGNAQRLCPMTSFSAQYEHEFTMNFTAIGDVALKRYFANAFVPMATLSGTPVPSVASNELHLRTRFSWDETVNRGYFKKNYVNTRKPIVCLDLTGGIAGIREGDCSFLRPEVTVDWKFHIPPIGMSKIHFNAGTILGQVPWPLLHLHEGNGTYLLDKNAFSCMDYFEFASDTWATLFWHHCLNGFILGKIPLLRRMQLREEFTFKAAYGTMRDKNNALLPGSDAPMAFPYGMKTMDGKPYIEAGIGVSNILRLIRVDANWRLTHRDGARQTFCVTAGLELRF